ncbi:MAG TPA: oxidoreductase [Actinomycetes bacterium]|nr:oxidoreductase [Actinomycetes bacterium]
MTWTEADIPDQTGRVAVVTGANGGLGLETARALAAKGAHVVLAARNPERAARAQAGILAGQPTATLEVGPLDLGSLASIRAFAERLRGEHPRLDLLVNNAGVMATPEGRTEDGFETQFGVNHLGHFALTARLLPALLRAPAARVVTVTSTARHTGRPIDPDNPHLHGRYNPWRAYGQSKLANVHFALGLQQRLHEAGATAISLIAHPGLSNTDLQAASVRGSDGGTSQRFWHWLAAHTGMSPALGALPQLRAATDPRARGGQLYAPRFVNFGPPVRRPLVTGPRDRAAIRTLWTVSERETGITVDIPGLLAQAGA